MKSNLEQLKIRGYITEEELITYNLLTKFQLLELLESKISTERTIGARFLVHYKEKEVLFKLISRLIVEKKLYSKIALSEAISEFGEEAIEVLIEYLGKIGNNQHKALPTKPFDKKSYPLPRDIIARTLCKIGKPALKSLKHCLYNGDYFQKLEVVDAIGFISYYENDDSCKEDILQLIHEYKQDDLMTWKLLRALQAFKGKQVLEELERYTTSDIKQHRWEAIRSIEQIKRK